jgi:hypothetical protein
LLSAAVLAAGAVLPPAAGATDFTATFDSTNQGFLTAQFDANGQNASASPSIFVGSGGNPGGFIRHDDPDSGASEQQAIFVTPVEPVPADYGATISFDLRSTATSLRPPAEGWVYITVAGASSGVYCAFTAPTASFTNYATTLDADLPCWKNIVGNADATQSDIDAALSAGIRQVQINADFGTGANEDTDLDNFIFDDADPPVEREVSLKYKRSAKAFTGIVSQDEGPIADSCVDGVEVELYKESGDQDQLLDTDVTDANGKYKIAKKARKNKKYYAYAPGAGADPVCAAEASKTIKPL